MPRAGSGGEGLWTFGDVRVRVTGETRGVRHVMAEFGPQEASPSDRVADLAIRFGPTQGRRGHHKATWWRVRAELATLGPPQEATVEVHGLFGYPLVQSLIVEQLIGSIAPARGLAMIPGAGLMTPDGRVVAVLGGSGAGKTAISLAALQAGWTLLSDDHLLIDASGSVRGMPRRMRLHGSTLEVVPGARAALLPAERSRQTQLAALDRLTLGRVRLPNLVPPSRFGTVRPDPAVPIGSVVAIERHPDVGRRTSTPAADAVLDLVADAVARERVALRRALRPAWEEQWTAIEHAEREILARGLSRVRLESLHVPTSWSPTKILEDLAERVPGGSG